MIITKYINISLDVGRTFYYIKYEKIIYKIFIYDQKKILNFSKRLDTLKKYSLRDIIIYENL